MNEHRGWEYGRTSALVGRLLEACDNARQILSRLRQFNHIALQEFETCDINKILGSTVDFLEFECRRNEVEIKMNLASLPLQVHANNAHLQQVVVNLFINAFEAMSEVAAEDRSLIVSSRQEEDLVVVEISDSGPGLTVSDDVAFTAFESTQADGLGMGLSICSRIIEDHSGRISGSSRTGKGATFRIEFPKAG
jgi:C4-dicarboxylate-specific signal transduction histidine kinase